MKKAKIFIVEDEALTAKNLEKMLQRFGYDVVGTVATGEEAIEFVRKENPDLILMDIILDGELDGIETARKIITGNNIPIIYTTAHSDEATLARAKATGPYGYLIKPMNGKDIQSAIDLALYRFAMEMKLVRSEEKYRDLVNNINDVLYSIDENGIITYISRQITEVIGFDPVNMVGRLYTSFIHEEDGERAAALFKKHLQGYTEQIDFRFRSCSGDSIWVRANSRPLIVNGQFRGVKGVLNNITTAKEAELELKKKNEELEAAYNALKHEKNLLALLMEISPAGILIISNKGIVTFANLRAEEVLGFSRTEMMGEFYLSERWAFRDVDGTEYPREKNPFLKALKSGTPVYDTEMFFIRSDRTTIILSVNASPLYYGSGEIEAVVMSVEDMTASRKAEEKIKSSLKEKDLLLREIHHRIKNNFQIITSLISLQIPYFRDSDDIKLINQTQQRIRSISMIYDKLRVSDTISTIDLKEYIEGLIEEIFNSFNSGDRIRVVQKMASVVVPVNIAVTCGIIINEMLTNVIKHAFPEDVSGIVGVECETGEDLVILKVSDNGKGIPGGFDPLTSSSMGFQLINALAAQLEGTLLVDSGEGTCCTLSFPLVPVENK
ncbi:MAG TPA: PAS domain S-box protein [Spirochaetota bacterium]|nr:PAS domain S-box protein [Spirochaetota bacterium]HPI88519.1 PAS domain S-box protein [Spirochaetota bacterium]HPR47999.1 PAS domain S-box protein [Spirochaetota bacterium]